MGALRLPAESRLQRLHNASLALQAMAQASEDLSIDVHATAKRIVDGDAVTVVHGKPFASQPSPSPSPSPSHPHTLTLTLSLSLTLTPAPSPSPSPSP